MKVHEHLKKGFDKARLKLKVLDRPIGGLNAEDIVQMSPRGERGGNLFRIYTGHEDNEISVIDSDPKNQQVLLRVREPARTFQTEEYDFRAKKRVTLTHHTKAIMRIYLGGMDERNYFISEVPKVGAVNKIKDAHRLLKPEKLKSKKKKDKNADKRQGEWFFKKCNSGELATVNQYKNSIQKKMNIEKPVGPARFMGNPHVADEVLFIGDTVYIRGKVRHDEHKTVSFKQWHRVYRNEEVREAGNRVASVTGWID